jgi:hypothetical protein
MEELNTLKQPRKEPEMLKIVDYGYADTNENLPKINIEEWKLSRASRIDYSVRNGYGVFESSNGGESVNLKPLKVRHMLW